MFVLLATICTVAHAEEFGIARRVPAVQQPSQQILPYVVRMIAFDSGGQSFGTGSYIGTYGEYGIILTNWHVVSETNGLVHVHFPSGYSSFGARIGGDDKWDLALIAISRPPQSIPILTISQTPAKKGDLLWIVGFGSGSYRIARGECVRYLAPPKDGTDPLYEILEVSVSARKGDSGGPILNQRGELAGVLFGSDMIQNTAGSYSERVNHFLRDTQGKMTNLPERPESYFATIEKDGPLHSLRDSRNAVPQAAELQQRPDLSGSSMPSGIRASSRRYVPNVGL
jgi:S1-C subfamily serine protease